MIKKKTVENGLIFMVIFCMVVLNLSSTPTVLIVALFVYQLTLFVLLCGNEFKIKSNRLLFAYLWFCVLCFISYFYADDSYFVLSLLPRVLSFMVVFFIFLIYFRSGNDIKRVLNFFFINVLALVIYNLRNLQYARSFEFGGANPMGTLMFFSILFVFYFLLYRKYKYLVLLPLFVFVLLLTASQKAILTLVIVFILFLVLNTFYNGISRVILYLIYTGFIIGISLFFFSNNPNLSYSYQRTFATVETIISGEREEGAAGGLEEGSFRGHLRDVGWGYFLDKPIVGHGLNNFRPRYGRDTGLFTYSHFTPIELLVGLGIVGFAVYYYFYVSVVLISWRYVRTYKTMLSFYFFVVLVGIFIISLFQQMYFDLFTALFVSVVYMSTSSNIVVKV